MFFVSWSICSSVFMSLGWGKVYPPYQLSKKTVKTILANSTYITVHQVLFQSV